MLCDLDVGITSNAAVSIAVVVVVTRRTTGRSACWCLLAHMCRCGAVECVGHLLLFAERRLQTVIVVVVVGSAAHRFVVVVGDGENDGGSWVGYLDDVN